MLHANRVLHPGKPPRKPTAIPLSGPPHKWTTCSMRQRIQNQMVSLLYFFGCTTLYHAATVIKTIVNVFLQYLLNNYGIEYLLVWTVDGARGQMSSNITCLKWPFSVLWMLGFKTGTCHTKNNFGKLKTLNKTTRQSSFSKWLNLHFEIIMTKLLVFHKIKFRTYLYFC